MSKYVIGLDIGGTKITGIVYDGKSVVRQLSVTTPKQRTEFKKRVEKLLRFLSDGRGVTSVGVGMAGVVDAKVGKVVFAQNLKYLNGFLFKRFVKTLKFKQVSLDNDANCFTLAELMVGKGKDYKNFVGLTLGTGIGAGIVLKKKLYRGSHGSAGEAGHIMSDFKNDSEHYFQIARKKNNYVKMGESLGLLFANIFNLLDVDTIVLGGSVALNAHKKFLPAALRVAKKHIVNPSIKPKVLVSNLKNSAAIGAALLTSESL